MNFKLQAFSINNLLTSLTVGKEIHAKDTLKV